MNKLLNMDKKIRKNLVILMIVLINILLFLGLILAILSDKSKFNNGYTASNDEVLKIREYDTQIALKVTSKPKIYIDNTSYMAQGDYISINLELENISEKKLTLMPINFSLLDKNKNVLATSNYTYQNDQQIHNRIIEPKRKIRGSLFFSSVKDSASAKTEDLIKEVSYLKISVISQEQKNNDDLENEREDYYLIIK